MSKLKNLAQQKDKKIKLTGHADNIGSEAVNNQISLQRVNAVKLYLIDLGDPAHLFTTKVMGESQPVESNETPDGRAKNWRVEITQLK